MPPRLAFPAQSLEVPPRHGPCQVCSLSLLSSKQSMVWTDESPCPWKGICMAASVRLLQMELVETLMCRFLCEHVFPALG